MYKRLIFLFGILFIFQSCSFLRGIKSNINHTSSTNLNFTVQENNKFLIQAHDWIGIPYKNGGVDLNGMDCSGLLYRLYTTDVDFSIPRAVLDQENFGLFVPQNKLEIGDWLFFKTNNSTIMNHVGIVKSVKFNQVIFIHASTSKGVREDDLFAKYWNQSFVKAIRPFKQLKK